MGVTGSPRTPIPVSVLTGFLGAGKTTLLSCLLKSPDMADTAVIINEFGEISLDHLLVESADESIIELKGGCLCCQIQGDLVATLEDLLRRRDNDRISPFRRVVIETTGLADPAPVLQALMLHPYLTLRYTLSSVVTVVDAANAMATLDEFEESVRQVAVADRLVITKSDIAGTDGALIARLRALNPSAPILDAVKGEAVPERLFDCGLYDPFAKGADVAKWLGDGGGAPHSHGNPDGEHGHDGAHGHDGDHAVDLNRHDARIRAFVLREERPIGRDRLEMFVDLLRAEHGEELLRVKGIVAIAGEPERPLVVHGVQHIFHPPVFLDAWPDDDRTTRMVFIIRDGDEGKIAALFSAFTDQTWLETELVLGAGNPLATPGGGVFRP